MRHMQLAGNDVFDNTEHEEIVPELEEIVHSYHWERLSAMDHELSVLGCCFVCQITRLL